MARNAKHMRVVLNEDVTQEFRAVQEKLGVTETRLRQIIEDSVNESLLGTILARYKDRVFGGE